MVFKGRQKCNSVVDSRGMAVETNEKNTDKGRCFLCLGAEDVKQILLDFLQTRNSRTKCLNGKWVNVSKEAAYREAIFFPWRCSPSRARASSFLTRFLDHTHNDPPQSVGLLQTSDQPVADTSTWQNTTLKTNKHPCPRRDSNPQSREASGRRPTP
jgi:hypothetical protein